MKNVNLADLIDSGLLLVLLFFVMYTLDVARF